MNSMNQRDRAWLDEVKGHYYGLYQRFEIGGFRLHGKRSIFTFKINLSAS